MAMGGQVKRGKRILADIFVPIVERKFFEFVANG
jgi:hypothetical protein